MKHDGRLARLGTTRLPLRLAYPLVGVLLAAALSVGLLVVRSVLEGEAMTVAWIDAELAVHGFTYAYVALSTSVLLTVLGYVLGVREEGLWTSSQIDPLTRVANRRHFDRALAEELSRARVSGMPLALLALDLDHLKAINDRGGHAAGDAALQTLAEVIRASVRSRDLAARLGGDEFAIVVPRTHAHEARALAERVRTSLSARWEATAPPPHRRGARSLGVSIGIADIEGAGSTDPEALFLAADRALYLAKSLGRNRTVVASQLEDTAVAGVPARSFPADAHGDDAHGDDAYGDDDAADPDNPSQCAPSSGDPTGGPLACVYAPPACVDVDLSVGDALLDATPHGSPDDWNHTSDVRRRVAPSGRAPALRAAQRR